MAILNGLQIGQVNQVEYGSGQVNPYFALKKLKKKINAKFLEKMNQINHCA